MNGRGKHGGIVRIALSGLRAILRERSSRAHLGVTLVVLMLGIVLEFAHDEWAWSVLALTLVWTAEAFNTAVERLGDAISVDPHPKIGAAKDAAAAAVLICIVGSAIILLNIFWPRLGAWF